MRKLIYIVSFLFTSFIFAQGGGPKVDVVKYRGEVTTAVKNTFDVPVGETWLVWENTSKRWEYAESDDIWIPLGDVIGPASSTDNAIALFDGTTGKLLKNSPITIIEGSPTQIDFAFSDLVNARSINTSVSVETSFLESQDFKAIPTDLQPANEEGRFYADNSENRPKYHDGTSWKAFLLEGDVAGTDDQTLSEVLTSGNDAGGLGIDNLNFIDIDSPSGGVLTQFGADSPFAPGANKGQIRHFANGIRIASGLSVNNLKIDYSALTQTRTLTMPDADVDLGNIVNNGYVFQTISASEIFNDSDVADTSRKWNKVTTNDTITLDATITKYGVPFVIESLADSVYIKKGASTTFHIEGQSAGITQNGVTAYTRSPLTVIAESSNIFSIYGNIQNLITEVTVNPWELNGYWGSIDGEANVAYASEAASGVYISNVASLGGTQSAYTADPNTGTYSLLVTAADGASDRLRLAISGLTNGEVYEYQYSYKMVTGTSGRFRIQNGDLSFPVNNLSLASTTWATSSGEFTYSNATNSFIYIEIYAADSGSASDQIAIEFDLRLKND